MVDSRAFQIRGAQSEPVILYEEILQWVSTQYLSGSCDCKLACVVDRVSG